MTQVCRSILWRFKLVAQRKWSLHCQMQRFKNCLDQRWVPSCHHAGRAYRWKFIFERYDKSPNGYDPKPTTTLSPVLVLGMLHLALYFVWQGNGPWTVEHRPNGRGDACNALGISGPLTWTVYIRLGVERQWRHNVVREDEIWIGEELYREAEKHRLEK